ncbi:MAG TPA: HAD family hydrolase [Methanocellaceae archaeon]|jgi:putative hydrolase of the HAD superfamily
MPKDRSIDTVTFDLWNTLIAHDRFYDDNIRRCRTECILGALSSKGLSFTNDDFERAYMLSERHLTDRWSTDMDMDVDEQLCMFLRCLGVEPSSDLVETIDEPYTDAVLKVMPFLVSGAGEAIREMKDRKFKVALISNTGRTPGKAMRKVMKEFGILDLFDTVTFSNESGYLKPHPKIFEETLSRLGSRPENAVHIGDHAVLDILGAKNAGMRSVLVTEYAQQDRCCVPDARIGMISELPAAIDSLEK